MQVSWFELMLHHAPPPPAESLRADQIITRSGGSGPGRLRAGGGTARGLSLIPDRRP